MPPIKGRRSGYLVRQEIKYLGFALCACVSVFLLARLASRQHWGFFPVFFFLVPLAVVAILLQHHWKRLSKNYARGEEGEIIVLEELEKLPDHTFVIQDVILPDGFGNIDIVVIAPAGVFTVEVKNNKYCNIGYRDKKLLCNQKPFENDILGQSRRQALDLHKYLRSAAGVDTWVIPTVVFPHGSTFVRFGLTPVDGVVRVIGLRWVRKLFLETFPPKLSDGTVLRLYKALKPLHSEEETS